MNIQKSGNRPRRQTTKMAEKQLSKLERAAFVVKRASSDLAGPNKTLANITEIAARSFLAAEELKVLGQEKASAVYEAAGSKYQVALDKYLKQVEAHEFSLL